VTASCQHALLHFQFDGGGFDGFAVLVLDHAIHQTVLYLGAHFHRIGGLGDRGFGVLFRPCILYVPGVFQPVAAGFYTHFGGGAFLHRYGLWLGDDAHGFPQQEGLGLYLFAVFILHDAVDTAPLYLVAHGGGIGGRLDRGSAVGGFAVVAEIPRVGESIAQGGHSDGRRRTHLGVGGGGGFLGDGDLAAQQSGGGLHAVAVLVGDDTVYAASVCLVAHSGRVGGGGHRGGGVFRSAAVFHVPLIAQAIAGGVHRDRDLAAFLGVGGLGLGGDGHRGGGGLTAKGAHTVFPDVGGLQGHAVGIPGQIVSAVLLFRVEIIADGIVAQPNLLGAADAEGLLLIFQSSGTFYVDGGAVVQHHVAGIGGDGDGVVAGQRLHDGGGRLSFAVGGPIGADRQIAALNRALLLVGGHLEIVAPVVGGGISALGGVGDGDQLVIDGFAVPQIVAVVGG